jgi:hypothetical protein
MTHAHDAIREHLLSRVWPREPDPRFALAALAVSEWSPRFERCMRNRLLMGAFRYGLIADPGRPDFDRVEYAHRKLRRYLHTRNLESLIDVANLCLLEFEDGVRRGQPFASIDDTDEHQRVKN